VFGTEVAAYTARTRRGRKNNENLKENIFKVDRNT